MPRIYSRPADIALRLLDREPGSERLGFGSWRPEPTSSRAADGIRCPDCGSDQTFVVNSRATRHHGGAIRRRRACMECKRRFTTLEVIFDQGRLAGNPFTLSDRQRRLLQRAVKILQDLQDDDEQPAPEAQE